MKTVLLYLAGLSIWFAAYSSGLRTHPETEPTTKSYSSKFEPMYIGQLECVYHMSTSGGVSCNWPKYNAQVAKCEEEYLKYRTSKDGTVFPPVKGRCTNLFWE